MPLLSDLHNFTNCKHCIKALPGNDVLVTCRSEGGSPPVHINIYKDGEPKVSQTSHATVAAEMVFMFKATPDYEWAEIICNVSNDATDAPLSTSANVYLYRKLHQIQFTSLWHCILSCCTFEPPQKKTTLAYVQTKTQFSSAVTAQLISAFVFATWIVRFLFYLYSKF